MPGVFLPGDRRVEIREVPVPAVGHGQVLVRMKASSICGSDLRAIYRPTEQGTGPEAYRGVIAGHEPAGVVERVGPGVSRFDPGDRVAVYHIAGCGLCHDCRTGWMISCTSPERAAYGWQRDGGHAPYMLAEERTLVALPDELTFLDGSIVACGLGTAYAGCMRLGHQWCRPGTRHRPRTGRHRRGHGCERARSRSRGGRSLCLGAERSLAGWASR